MDDPVAPPSPPVPPVSATSPGPPRRDRSGLLVLFGVAEILLGAVGCLMGAGVFVMLVVAAQTQPAAPTLPVSNIVVVLAVYLGGGAAFIVLGAGTLRARRWARAVMLLLCWPWLVAGILTTGFIYFLSPFIQQAGRAGPVSAGVMAFIMIFTGLVMVALPAALLLFYSGPNVRRTFETRHPQPSWVDGRPLPVLGFGGAMFVMGLFVFLGLPRGAAPAFGFVLTGGPAYVFGALHGLFCIWLGMEIVRMSKGGWWMNFLYPLASHLSGFLTLKRLGMAGMLDAMGRSEVQAVSPDLMRGIAQAAPWLGAISVAFWLGALLWLRRYYPAGTFDSRDDAAAPGRLAST